MKEWRQAPMSKTVHEDTLRIIAKIAVILIQHVMSWMAALGVLKTYM